MGHPLVKIDDEARTDVRGRTLLGGKLVYGEGAITLDCMIRDLSDGGARIKLSDEQPLPNALFLIELRSGVAYEAAVAWKRYPELGLRFVSRHELETADTPHLRVLRRLWTETRARSGV